MPVTEVDAVYLEAVCFTMCACFLSLLPTDVQTMLSAVIICGPSTLQLSKPVVLSFPHCASVKHGQWMLSAYASDSPYEEPPSWRVSALC